MRLETTDLSRGGCYVQLMMPSPVGLRLQATLWLDGYPIVVRGLVVTRHPQFGNGIMFVDFEGQGDATAESLPGSHHHAVRSEVRGQIAEVRPEGHANKSRSISQFQPPDGKFIPLFTLQIPQLQAKGQPLQSNF